MGFSLQSVNPNKEYRDPTKNTLSPLPEKGQLFLEGKRTKPKSYKVSQTKKTTMGQGTDVQTGENWHR